MNKTFVTVVQVSRKLYISSHRSRTTLIWYLVISWTIWLKVPEMKVDDLHLLEVYVAEVNDELMYLPIQP